MKLRFPSEPRVLVVGEAEAEPWRYGKSAARLRMWFEARSWDELRARVLLANVFEEKGSTLERPEHVEELREAAEEADLVLLVGAVAQEKLRPGARRPGEWLWRDGKWVGLPHPSDLNRQLNVVSDYDVRNLVREATKGGERGNDR